ncbi:GNAT family N-acetyltransferase [Rhizobium sp. BR 314]|uniref:GNAT family N-acetyltransferase n=1 Tax=Rhizobium sp. BR 314 TaxID=3040013 RepID=UPI0039BFAB7C
MQIHLREAREADLTELGELKFRASVAWGDFVEELQNLPDARHVSREHLPHIIVAELEGTIAGFVTILPGDDASHAELEDLFVAPSFWRNGIGAKLLATAEARAVVLGAARMHVVANERARLFYEAAGYRLIGMVQTDFASARELCKSLRPVQ